MRRYQLLVYPDRCTGCLRCMLTCSRQYSGRFNPEKAFLRVSPAMNAAGIIFLDECNRCGLCADNCFFEALVKTGTEAAV